VALTCVVLDSGTDMCGFGEWQEVILLIENTHRHKESKQKIAMKKGQS